MDNLSIISWVLAYTLSGAVLLLGLALYIQKREKKISAFLLLMLNIFAITIISFLYSLNLLSDRLFAILLQNALLFLYLILPNLLFTMNNLPFRKWFYIAPFLILMVLLNLFALLGYNIFNYFFVFSTVIFFLYAFVLYLRLKKRGISSSAISIAKFFKSIDSAWNLTGLVAAFMGICSLFIYFVFPINNPLIYSLFFSFFYSLYSLPSLCFIVYELFFAQKKLMEMDDLTEREREVANLIMDGKKYREIGEELFISLSTVKKHANNIYRKTGASNGRELIRIISSRKS